MSLEWMYESQTNEVKDSERRLSLKGRIAMFFAQFVIGVLCMLLLAAFVRWICVPKDKQLLCALAPSYVAMAWPMTLLAIVVIFHDAFARILYQVPGLIYRSRYDNKNESIGSAELVATQRVKSAKEDKESRVISRIEEMFGVNVLRESMLGGSRVRFDAAFVKDGYLHIVEVKYLTGNSLDMANVSNRVVRLLSEISIARRKYIKLVLCLVGKDCMSGETLFHQYAEKVRLASPVDTIVLDFNAKGIAK